MTPKKEKTTVDRIVREMLMDKKNVHPSVKRVYQLMLNRGEIYKASKHKRNMNIMSTSTNFTSKNIEDGYSLLFYVIIILGGILCF